MGKKMRVVMVSCLLALQLAGCSGKPNQQQEPQKGKEYVMSTEPMTIQVLNTNATITDDEFDKFFVQPVKKKYPNITMQLVRLGKDITIESLLAAGDLPDILLASTTGVAPLQKLDVVEDLNPYIKKFSVDLNRFDPVLIDALKSYSVKGETVAMPYAMNFSALFYNKDLFDKFAVPYPKDGMTWDDAKAIAPKLTRSEGGVAYRGLNPGGANLMGFGLSLPYADKKTNQALLNTDKWKMVVEEAVSIYQIPGYVVDGSIPGGQGHGFFLKDRNWAMSSAWGDNMIGSLESYQKQGNPINWDMVTIPYFKEAQGLARESDFHMLHLSKTGKHKDEAFQILTFIASDEVQSIINKSGRLTVLKKTSDYQKNFGADLETMKGKNLNAVFGVKPNKLHVQTEFDSKGRGLIDNAAFDVVLKKIDINTAIQNAQDQLQQYIQDQLGK